LLTIEAFGWTVETWNGPFEYYLIKTGESPEPGIDGGLIEEKNPDQHVELGEMSGV
jgi:predicted enzyme related to lactoylglutathione lyase